MFSILLINDIYVKQLAITQFYTTLTIFFNLFQIVRMTNNLKRMEYRQNISTFVDSLVFFKKGRREYIKIWREKIKI